MAYLIKHFIFILFVLDYELSDECIDFYNGEFLYEYTKSTQ